MSLLIENLRVSYGKTLALDGVNIRLEPGEMFFLLGPSGCGKSTLLRTVAGFIEQFEGGISVNGEPLQGVPAHKRDFGMVFQNYALFPHLTVADNVAYGLEARRVPADDRKPRVAEALQMAGLAGYEARRPGELSGGQQQRVALARALVIRPRVLLLDEPLSNLDARLRWEMREEIRRIHRQTKLTTLYVTHDQKEALSLADRMAILRAGKAEAIGAPRELYRHPPTRFCAEFLGDINTVKGTLPAQGTDAQTKFGPVPLRGAPPPGLNPGAQALFFCRPENVSIRQESARDPWPADFVELQAAARVHSSAFLGENTLYELELPHGVRWRALRHDTGAHSCPEGSPVRVAVDRRAWAALPGE